MNKRKRDLNPEQWGAIIRAIELARILQIEHPEIADRYRNGSNIPMICQEFKISRDYGASESVAYFAVYRALRGSEIKNIQLEGLIPFEEFSELAKYHLSVNGSKAAQTFTLENRIKNGSITGKMCYSLGKGAFAIPPGTRKEISKRVGDKAYREKTGIHAMSPEERKNVAIQANLARGNTPWADEEIEEISRLGNLPDYQYINGKYSGKPNYNLIANQLNEKYHSGKRIRDARDIATKVYRVKKQKEKNS